MNSCKTCKFHTNKKCNSTHKRDLIRAWIVTYGSCFPYEEKEDFTDEELLDNAMSLLGMNREDLVAKMKGVK